MQAGTGRGWDMEYKNYLIRDDRIIKRGDGGKDAERVDLDKIRSIEKIRISRRKLIFLGVLSVIFLVSLAGSFTGDGLLPFITTIALFGSFIMIAATVASALVTDRYAIKTQNDELKLSVRGSKGHRFIREIQEKAGNNVDAGFSYDDKDHPFNESARRRQINIGVAILVIVGAVLGAVSVAPMYADNVTWEGETDSVDAPNGDSGGSGGSPVSPREVYEEKDDGNVFTSEYATVEFSQEIEDLDKNDSTLEKYVNIDFTPHSAELASVYVEIPASQNMRTEQDVDIGEWYEMGYTEPEEQEGDEWVRAIVWGELENNSVVKSPLSENKSYLDKTQTLRPGAGTPNMLLLSESRFNNMGESTNKFIKGVITKKKESRKFPSLPPMESPPNVVGFEQDDIIRITGTIYTEEGSKEVVLGNYTVE